MQKLKALMAWIALLGLEAVAIVRETSTGTWLAFLEDLLDPQLSLGRIFLLLLHPIGRTLSCFHSTSSRNFTRNDLAAGRSMSVVTQELPWSSGGIWHPLHLSRNILYFVQESLARLSPLDCMGMEAASQSMSP